MSNWKEDNKTILTLQMGDTVETWETIAPCNDVPIEELIQAFYSQLVGFTYLPCSVMRAFRDFVDTNQEYVDVEHAKDIRELESDDHS